MKISILEKVRAPSRIEFRKGLGCEACCPRLVDGHGNQVGTEDNRLEETSFGCHDPIAFRERLPDEVADHETDKNTNCCSVHIYLLKEQFSAALLPQKLSVSYDSNNTANIACMGFKVKPNRKSLYLKAFSRPLYYWIWIKKFLLQASYLIRDNLKKEYERFQSLPNFSKKFIYAPLQVQPECSNSPQGGVFADQILMLETLAAALPDDWLIYVKEHPIQWPRIGLEFSSYKYRGYYQKISEIKNVKIVPLETDSYKLNKESQAVATITGASGWEAMLWSKPAIIFGYPWYIDCF